MPGDQVQVFVVADHNTCVSIESFQHDEIPYFDSSELRTVPVCVQVGTNSLDDIY